ncbi:HD domain-containing protein [Nostocoides australiense]|uniref:Metal-dependent phosphohydrolase n=1 Tax=Nostocoides australiense Ben110 TaxID=1193182 RepID=W6K342_9MICO|nr:hypothetical protein [Tetrasphaera australiensis]MCA0292227.1 metal-dependent phosphohydrolase [Actinomycetota bacterium]MCB1301671.1 hypothetical protein [Tetrasphaera sp.]CCH75706.1 conserved hypothetical protein [Tetrasphaera australiensis Ben110]
MPTVTPDRAFGHDVHELSDAPDGAAIGAAALRLWQRYRETHRHYHDLRHLDEVLAAIGEIATAATEIDLARVRLAACYHDAVYDPAATDNEARSAALAGHELSILGVPDGHLDVICRLIIETAAHALPPSGSPSAWLHDADLWILAAPPERFDQYCRAVRAEYAAVPTDAYATGRSAILTEFLDRPALYAEPSARHDWEPLARSNIAREIARLDIR